MKSNVIFLIQLYKINVHCTFFNKYFSPKASYGYGGKFGVQKDRMDKVLYGLVKVVYVITRANKEAVQIFGITSFIALYFIKNSK